MKKKVEEALIEMGVYPNLYGFNYICKAVEIISKNRERMKIVDGLYVETAKAFDSTKFRVERGIRQAISKMNKDSDAYKKYIGIEDTANSAVLYTLAVRLKDD